MATQGKACQRTPRWSLDGSVTAPVATERDIQAAIITYLRYRHFYVQRLNSGGMRDARNNLVTLARAGTADIVFGLVVDGYIFLAFVEVKRPGGKQRPAQKLFQQDMDARGIPYILATSIDDVDQGIAAFTQRVRARPLARPPSVADDSGTR